MAFQHLAAANRENTSLAVAADFCGLANLKQSSDTNENPGVALLEAAEAGDADACAVAITALRKLPGLQVATIAACAFFALDDDAAEDVMKAVIRRAGWPLPDALAPMHGARLWARDASRAERKAFALAAFEALGEDDRQAFRQFTGRAS